jgi:hypothetical protein
VSFDWISPFSLFLGGSNRSSRCFDERASSRRTPQRATAICLWNPFRMRTRSMATTPVTVVPTVPEHLTCCICFEAFEDPVFHGCGRNHGFCRECCCSLAVAEAETVMDTAGPSGAPAVQLSSVSGGTSLLGTEPPPASITIACPLCRTRSPFSSLVPADELVTQLELHATDCEACGERVSLGALKRHRRRCSANANAVAMETETTDTQWRRRVRALRGNQTLSGSAVQETAAAAAATQTNNVTYRNRSTFTCPLCVEDGTVVTGNEDHPVRAFPTQHIPPTDCPYGTDISFISIRGVT